MMSVCLAEPTENGDASLHAVFVDVHQQVDAELLRQVVAKLDHGAELPGGVHVQQRKGRLGRVERLHGQVQHDGGILADRVQHDRLFTLRGNLAHDVDAFRLELAQVGEFGLCRHTRYPWRQWRL
jgi:hypothetical protein